jgi:hypothetical protein
MKSHHAEVLEVSSAEEKTTIFNASSKSTHAKSVHQQNDAETSAKPTHVVQRKSTARVSGGAW